jgi:HK97 family phage major capsid protein
MSNVIFAKTAMRALGVKAQQITDNPLMTNTEKLAELKAMGVELKRHQATIATHDQASRLMSGGSSLGSDEGMAFGSQSFASSLKTGRIPRLNLTEEVTKALYGAVTSKQGLRIETKTTTDPGTLLPSALVPGIVDFRREPVRLLDFIPASPMAGPSIEFVQHVSTTGAATVVARGGTKPTIVPNLQTLILTARKVAAILSIPDETIQDFQGFVTYLQNELIRAITSTQNTEILSGDGTGEHILGLLNVSGILTRDAAADVIADANATGIDSIEMAITDLRVGPAFTEPDVIVMHPTTWSKLRRVKDSQKRYIVDVDPTSAEADSLFNVKVLPTTSIAAGTALVASMQEGAQAFVRTGMVLDVSNSTGTNFSTNTTSFRAEERFTVGCPRPAALCKVTNL